MKLLGLAAALVFAGCGGNTCEINVATMTGDVAGHVMLTGQFSSAQPLLNLKSMDGANHIVVCSVGADSTTADCNLAQNGITSGSYTVAFQESCNDENQDPGSIDIGGSVPATLTVP